MVINSSAALLVGKPYNEAFEVLKDPALNIALERGWSLEEIQEDISEIVDELIWESELLDVCGNFHCEDTAALFVGKVLMESGLWDEGVSLIGIEHECKESMAAVEEVLGKGCKTFLVPNIF